NARAASKRGQRRRPVPSCTGEGGGGSRRGKQGSGAEAPDDEFPFDGEPYRGPRTSRPPTSRPWCGRRRAGHRNRARSRPAGTRRGPRGLRTRRRQAHRRHRAAAGLQAPNPLRRRCSKRRSGHEKQRRTFARSVATPTTRKVSLTTTRVGRRRRRRRRRRGHAGQPTRLWERRFGKSCAGRVARGLKPPQAQRERGGGRGRRRVGAPAAVRAQLLWRNARYRAPDAGGARVRRRRRRKGGGHVPGALLPHRRGRSGAGEGQSVPASVETRRERLPRHRGLLARPAAGLRGGPRVGGAGAAEPDGGCLGRHLFLASPVAAAARHEAHVVAGLVERRCAPQSGRRTGCRPVAGDPLPRGVLLLRHVPSRTPRRVPVPRPARDRVPEQHVQRRLPAVPRHPRRPRVPVDGVRQDLGPGAVPAVSPPFSPRRGWVDAEGKPRLSVVRRALAAAQAWVDPQRGFRVQRKLHGLTSNLSPRQSFRQRRDSNEQENEEEGKGVEHRMHRSLRWQPFRTAPIRISGVLVRIVVFAGVLRSGRALSFALWPLVSQLCCGVPAALVRLDPSPRLREL
ncbi:hypothetical protein DIPPA_34879, partial [Diplonema papillatum]